MQEEREMSATEIDRESHARTLFVYARRRKIVCLSAEEVRRARFLSRKEWKHTATLDPALWIEALVNGKLDVEETLRELREGWGK